MKLIERSTLLGRLSDLRGTSDIKIITGIRRSGKSQLMKDYMDRIRVAYLRDVYETIINRDLVQMYRLGDSQVLGQSCHPGSHG